MLFTDHELYNTTMEDDRAHLDTTYTSTRGSALAATIGSISLISSLVVITLISKSGQGLSSVYHRIVLGISISDALLSLALALTTLPMPTDMIYDFEGIVMGNNATCSTQGFMHAFGGIASSCYGISLLVYYLFSIRYRWSDARFARRIEKVLHFLSVGYSCGLSLCFLFLDFYNPTPLDAWCTIVSVPWWCVGTF